MTRKLHIALGVKDIEESVEEYRNELGVDPEVVVAGEYALFRTPFLNMSIRRVNETRIGVLRHLGWEDPEANDFTLRKDCNSIVWERFTAEQQREEINQAWPGTIPDHPDKQ